MSKNFLKQYFLIIIPLLLTSFFSYTKELSMLTLSPHEYEEISKSKDLPYIYLGNEMSNIKSLVKQICDLNHDKTIPIIHELNDHLTKGYKIGRCDEVVKALVEAVTAYNKDSKYTKLIKQLENNIKKILKGKLNITINEQKMYRSNRQTEEIIAMQLKEQGIPIIIEKNSSNRNHENKTIHGNFTVTNDLTVKGKSKFKNKVTIEDDLKIKDELTVSGKSEFKKNAEFKKNVTIDGDLIVEKNAAFEGGIVGVACELDVGCNIFLKNSDITVGNILKNGVQFIHNCGTDNTFIGQQAGNLELSGTHSSGLGARALRNNTTGLWNTAVGADVLSDNTIGTGNAAIGAFSLCANVLGEFNVAFGLDTLRTNIAGSSNVAAGWRALYKATGNENIAIGPNAGENLALGDTNIYLGNYGKEVEYNTIRIGNNQEACFIQGIYDTTLTESLPVLIDPDGRIGTTISSSKKVKNNIADIDILSNGLMDLRPVQFTYKNDSSNTPHYGLIAEEVAEIYPELVVMNKEGNHIGVRYHELPAMLLNELKKHHIKFQQYDKKIQKLENAINLLLAEISVLKSIPMNEEIAA